MSFFLLFLANVGVANLGRQIILHTTYRVVFNIVFQFYIKKNLIKLKTRATIKTKTYLVALRRTSK